MTEDQSQKEVPPVSKPGPVAEPPIADFSWQPKTPKPRSPIQKSKTEPTDQDVRPWDVSKCSCTPIPDLEVSEDSVGPYHFQVLHCGECDTIFGFVIDFPENEDGVD